MRLIGSPTGFATRWAIYLAAIVVTSVVLGILAGELWARSASEVLAFKRHTPCPATGERRGACPGYQVDHIEPLCAGGVDKQHNMQWMTLQEHRWKTRTDVRVCRQLRVTR